MSNTFSDEEIIKTIKRGRDTKVYHQFYKLIFPKIKKMVLYKGGNDEDARDVFQDAIIVFYKKVKTNSYEHRTEIDAFIYSVSRNIWYNKIRKEKRQNYFKEGEESQLVATYKDFQQDEERTEMIMAIFSKIGERCKQLLTYKFYDGLNMKEITEKMGFGNENSAKTQHYKCKQKLIELVSAKKYKLENILRDA